jgi:hypothetical protein
MRLGVSPAVTLCARAEVLDPTPCVLPQDVAISRVDPDGVARLRDSLSVDDVLALLGAAPALAFRAQLGAADAEASLPLRFDPPPPLILESHAAGAAGPPLDVFVREQAAHVVFEVRSGQSRWVAVIDPSAPGQFAIRSRGADGSSGFDGSRGSDGMSGSDGSTASCHFPGGNGEDGHGGGDGGDGGPGQDGGEVHVLLACAADSCRQLAHAVVFSDPGHGGSGGKAGRGGEGGRGGRGGAGTPCDETLGSASSRSVSHAGGMDGLDGRRGSDGNNGRSGVTAHPGRIIFESSAPR